MKYNSIILKQVISTIVPSLSLYPKTQKFFFFYSSTPRPEYSACSPNPPKKTPLSDSSVPNRPSTGNPAPWAPRLSVIARVNQNEKSDEIKPVFVGEFPQVVRDEQASILHKHAHGDGSVSGGMERGLAWIVCGGRLFVWNFLSPAFRLKQYRLDYQVTWRPI